MLQAVSSETREVKTPSLLRRWRRAGAADSQPGRSCVQPPEPWGQAEPVWKALWGWLRATPATPGGHPLDAARRDFAAALADLDADDACDLRRRGSSARSLRELWHLRADLYSLVARHRSQPEADRRLQQVNRHFPTRTQPATAPRPGRSLEG